MMDEQIVALYWERAEQAIAETAAKYGRYCHTISYTILSSHEDAEECVNDTYIQAWDCIPPHRPSILSTFLGKITRRISIDRWRKRTARKRGGGELPLVLDELAECISDNDGPEQELDREQLSEVINTFVHSLPIMEQKVFLCRYWYMNSVNTIGKRFDYSESKVKTMLHRTRNKLRTVLSKEGFL